VEAIGEAREREEDDEEEVLGAIMLMLCECSPLSFEKQVGHTSESSCHKAEGVRGCVYTHTHTHTHTDIHACIHT
jgi:hypothetical protein